MPLRRHIIIDRGSYMCALRVLSLQSLASRTVSTVVSSDELCREPSGQGHVASSPSFCSHGARARTFHFHHSVSKNGPIDFFS